MQASKPTGWTGTEYNVWIGTGSGYTKEEIKVTWELQKIFGLPEDVAMACTALRVPTLRVHSESIAIETEKPADPDDAQRQASKFVSATT